MDSLDSDFRPMTRDIFKSTPNLKEQSASISGGTVSGGIQDPRKVSPRHVAEAPRPQSPAGMRTGITIKWFS